VITVFDEAHNIEGAARDHARKTLAETTLDSALEELAGVEDSRSEPARNVIEAFRDALIVTYEDELSDYERDNVGEHWEDVSVANPDARDEITLAFLRLYEGRGIDTETELAVQLGRTLDEEYERAYKDGEATSRAECQTLQAAQFISTWMDEGGELGQHPMAGVRRNEQTGDVYGRAELYTCIPREVTRDLFDEVYASVLMSATLRPFDVTEDVLGLDSPATMAYGLAYPEANRRTYAAKVPALFASERDDPGTQKTITELLDNVIRFTPGNTLLFFPSYSEAERYYGRLGGDRTDNALGNLILDESGVTTEDLRQRFVASDDATLFTSLWGTLAEGVSFDGDQARTVVVIGVPYPQLSERMEAVQDAYEARLQRDPPEARRRLGLRRRDSDDPQDATGVGPGDPLAGGLRRADSRRQAIHRGRHGEIQRPPELSGRGARGVGRHQPGETEVCDAELLYRSRRLRGCAAGAITTISRLRCVVDPLAKRVKILCAGLIGDIVKRAGRDRFGFWNRHRSNLAGIGVFVSKRRVAAFPPTGIKP
jgi:Rad3-related DNA helicases